MGAALARVVETVRAARQTGQTGEQERVGVVLDAATAGGDPLLQGLVRRLAVDDELKELIAVWGEDADPAVWGQAAMLRYPDGVGQWLREGTRSGRMQGVLFLGAEHRAGLVRRLSEGNGLGFRAEQPLMVKLLAAFVPEPLARELAFDLEEATGLGRQL